MRTITRSALLLALLLLATVPVPAQEPARVMVIGSGVVNSLIQSLAEANEFGAASFESVGAARGIDEFCNGDLDIATAMRPITGAEKAICGANEIGFSEFVLGHRILAFVAHVDAPAECLTEAQMQAIFKPSASAATVDWSFDGDAETELPLIPIAPAYGQLEHDIADGLIPGDGLRRDALKYATADEALAMVAATEGALALVGWRESLNQMEAVSLLEFSHGELGECVSPSAESVEQDQYSAALSLYAYVNRARLAANPQTRQLLEIIISDANADLMRQLGATPPTSATYRLNADLLADTGEAEGLAGEPGFVMPAALSGSLRIVGAAHAIEALDRVATALAQTNAELEISLDLTGRAHGLAQLCAGEADIALLDAEATDGDLSLCRDGGIATSSAPLGSQATVLIGNAADEHTRCLTADQINAVWRAESGQAVTAWSGVDPEFPDQEMILFGSTLLDQTSDILLQTTGPVIPPIRRDTEKDFNPLYRAAAVGNVRGALTYMNWHDYQRVLEAGQANIQLVAVDAGGGCVSPSPSTIADGSYALSRGATLLISQQSLAGVNAQAYLWSLFEADNWRQVEADGFVGPTALELPSLRLQLQRSFAEAEALHPAPDEANEAGETVDDSDDEASEGGG